MWWECMKCVAGGNDDGSMKHHIDNFPNHEVKIIRDTILEED